MELQTIPLSDEVQYFLDGALENYELTGGAHTALNLFGDRDRILQLYDHDQTSARRGWKARFEISLAYERYGAEIIDQLDEPLRNTFKAFVTSSIVRYLKSTADCMASWNFEDETKGGALQPYRKVVRLRGVEPTKRVRRRLYSPGAIRRYVKQEFEGFDQSKKLMACHKTILPDRPTTEEDHAAVSALWTRQSQIFRASGREMFNRAQFERNQWIEAAELNAAGIPNSQILAAVRSNTPLAKLKPKFKKHIRKRQKVMRRAAAIAAAFLGTTMVSSFVQGEPIKIPGQTVDFVVARKGSVVKEGHGALDIALHDQESGRRLAGLCYYEKDAPALDQLVSIALHVASGEEADLIRIGNLYSVDESIKHPVIEERQKKDRPIINLSEIADRLQIYEVNVTPRTSATNTAVFYANATYTSSTAAGTGWRQPYSVNLFQERVKEYVREVGDIYYEAVAIAVLGRAARHPFVLESMEIVTE